MRIYLHIGPEVTGAQYVRRALAAARDALGEQNALFARSPGAENHTVLYMAASDPGHIDPLRFNRGCISADAQTALRERLRRELLAEVEQADPKVLILTASQLSTSIYRRSEMERLRAILAPISTDIRIIAFVSGAAEMLLDHYALQVGEGRSVSLAREISMADGQGWWQQCLEMMPDIDPLAAQFEETQGAPFWLDLAALQGLWESVFGSGAVSFHGYRREEFASGDFPSRLGSILGLEIPPVPAPEIEGDPAPSAASLSRHRRFNEMLHRLLARRERVMPRRLWRTLLDDMALPGAPADPGGLHRVSKRFSHDYAALARRHPGLEPGWMTAPRRSGDWTEADPEYGFRASQYLLAAMHRIDQSSKSRFPAVAAELGRNETPPEKVTAQARQNAPAIELSSTARRLLPRAAVSKFETLRNSSFAPHNLLGAVDEEQLAAPFLQAPHRPLPEGRSGNVIVGCMKNEAPYIVEWIAYHRAIGVDNFLIYSNGCEDGTAEILDRLQELGVLQHRNNDGWKGNSPQQYALNRSLKEPVIRDADWIIHIDVDEFINIRCGNGTLADFFDAVPDATNVAMTWRLFGHNGVRRLSEGFVIEQFDTCAPKFCPKPHTAWGFKTMFRNIGAYSKISCHRPNKLDEALRDRVVWVNGSGRDMTGEALRNGWRNSKKSIGYDLLQLNHYALRSAEGFLIKRQRGRALHVDRSIGLNYWIRMDWGDHRDITIKRNLPRLKGEYDRLMADDQLRFLHNRGLDWHMSKVRELLENSEFKELYEQALAVRLTGMERAAYALALDMES